MAYGSIKADEFIYDNNGTDVAASVQALATSASAIATNTTDIATNATNIATNTANITTNTADIATKFATAGGTFSGDVSFDGEAIVRGDGTNGSGKLTLNCENNSHGVKLKGPAHSAAANYTLTLPDTAGTAGQALTTDGSGGLSWDAYMPIDGAVSMLNPLVLSGDPLLDDHAARKLYVDTQIAANTAGAVSLGLAVALG